jgi:hypothetical protein
MTRDGTAVEAHNGTFAGPRDRVDTVLSALDGTGPVRLSDETHKGAPKWLGSTTARVSMPRSGVCGGTETQSPYPWDRGRGITTARAQKTSTRPNSGPEYPLLC